MWGKRRQNDIVAASMQEAQKVRSMLSESSDLLDDIGRDLNHVLTAASRALLDHPASEPLTGPR
jgi:hypothetical protein